MAFLATLELLLVLQSDPATVTGIVRDEVSGEPLVNVAVVLPDLNRTTSTDASGRYTLLQVPPGPQHLTIRFIGYASRTLDALVPREGRLEINVALRPDAIRLAAIEVRAPSLDPASLRPMVTLLADRRVVTSDLRSNPLLAEPDIIEALGGGEVVMDPESPNGIHIRGGASDQAAYLLDGIPILNPYHAAGMFSAWNPDALAGAELSSSMPSSEGPEALSGTIAAQTRDPGERTTVQGGLSTSQARLTTDGRIGSAGFLVSGRTGFLPGFNGHHDASYLVTEVSDALAKLELPLLGGQLNVLGYQNHNEISADAEPGSSGSPILRNDFSWQSGSYGVSWNREVGTATLHLSGWRAATEAGARWSGTGGVLDLSAERQDRGLGLMINWKRDRQLSVAGIRMERSHTAYDLRDDSTGAFVERMDAVTPVLSLVGLHDRTVGRRFRLSAGGSASLSGGAIYWSPRVQARHAAGDRVTFTASAARLHQFNQSLRNAESIVGYVFPADLFVGADAPGVSVARSDQLVAGIDLVPAAGLLVQAQAYTRSLDGLVLVAPGEAEPFASRSLMTGQGSSRGASVRASVKASRYAVTAAYGYQRVALRQGDSSFVPAYGATHLLQGGIAIFPTATSSLRLGLSGGWGRRTTAFDGGFEWEACNLLDQGCEFAGSPHYGNDRLGGAALPGYFRMDLSARKHWHIHLADREAMVALFATVTNLFGRKNLLGYGRNPAGGQLTGIEMRPLSPLVVGLDWRF